MLINDNSLEKDMEKYKELVDSGVSPLISINKFKTMDNSTRKKMLELMEEFREED